MNGKSNTAGTALLTVVLMIAAAGTARADGAFLTAPEYQIYERQQVAVLSLEDGVEDLQILPEFDGDAQDFVWIVPVPGLPTVRTSNPELFFQADDMTRPLYKHRDAEWGCAQEDYQVLDAAGVVVIGDEMVGAYRTLILAADDATALADSLATWGYLNAENEAMVTPVLQSYVDREWYFVAMKVDESALNDELPYLTGYWYGLMQPIGLRFPSEELVYPLYISSLSSYGSANVNLFVIGEHRMEHPSMETWYANRISDSELAAIRSRYPAVAVELEEGDFLTRLVRPNNSLGFMQNDLVLERTDSDTELRLINYSGLPVWNLFLAGSMISWLALRMRRRMRRIPNTNDGV